MDVGSCKQYGRDVDATNSVSIRGVSQQCRAADVR